MTSPILRSGQVTVPAKLRKQYNLDKGGFVEFIPTKIGIVLKPKKLVDAPITADDFPETDAPWFFTEEWQKGEQEADKDIKNGDTIGPFENVEDALKALKTKRV